MGEFMERDIVPGDAYRAVRRALANREERIAALEADLVDARETDRLLEELGQRANDFTIGFWDGKWTATACPRDDVEHQAHADSPALALRALAAELGIDTQDPKTSQAPGADRQIEYRPRGSTEGA